MWQETAGGLGLEVVHGSKLGENLGGGTGCIRSEGPESLSLSTDAPEMGQETAGSSGPAVHQ